MFDLEVLIKTGGYLGIFAIIFAETGLMLGFFLPGDSLLFTAGIFAAQGFFDITLLCILVFIASVTGNLVGYTFGHKVGKRLFRKEDSLLFHKDHLIRAKNFYEDHGGKTIIIARFMPIIRTFAPIVAGMGDMPYSKFATYSVFGGILWAIGLPILGFYLGNAVPDIDRYLLPIIAFIILASVAPGFYHTLKTKDQRKKIFEVIKTILLKTSKRK